MEIKNMIFIGAIVLIVIGAIVWIFLGKKNSNTKPVPAKASKPLASLPAVKEEYTEKFKQDMANLGQLRFDLMQRVNQVVGSDVSGLYKQFMVFSPDTMCLKLQQNVPEDQMAYYSFDGPNMKDPVLNMHAKSPKLFQCLAACGLLTFLGKTIAITSWTVSGKNKSASGFKSLLQCLSTVDWNNLQTWQSIDDPKGQVGRCAS